MKNQKKIGLHEDSKLPLRMEADMSGKDFEQI